MRSFILGILAAFTVPVAVALFVLLSSPGLRHDTYRLAAEAPGIATYYLMRTHLINRDFGGINRWLNWQLDVGNSWFPGRNSTLPSLIDNTVLAVERARFPKEFAAIRPFLSRLVKSQPDLLPARVWLGRSLAHDDPKAALEELDAAVKLASTDERAYRVAFEILLRQGLTEELGDWCSRYRTAQFGGPRAYDYNNLFYGVGLRRMALEAVDEQGNGQLIRNDGVHLGEIRGYEFPLAAGAPIETLRLHLGLVAGVAVTIERLVLYHRGAARSFSAKDLDYTSWDGFSLEDGRVLIVASDDEFITFYPKEDKFGAADKIVIDMRFDRLSLASTGVCPAEGRS